MERQPSSTSSLRTLESACEFLGEVSYKRFFGTQNKDLKDE